ncbi:PREDICTED: UPF0585 protein C16orf13 homolog A-like [Priapulus caudatus]|uniref:UPF0585 protein C16orf13 homolog A-like n=1 Tax=Priapulus caudatus TaxID=37621 RepID=A0ABM1EE44_PRICU|nr:PREDICTED: UPF0585 protein C16orf13 homolog A-like [Priapulus caudatus]
MSTVAKCAAACDRNKAAILEVLKDYLPAGKPTHVLEIGSGTGVHGVHFTSALPHVAWQPSDCDDEHLSRIVANRQANPSLSNFLPPLRVDATSPADAWGVARGSADLLYSSNVVHVAPWAVARGLFAGATWALRGSGLLAMYGPFTVDGVAQPESNARFDAALRLQDPAWGLRDVRELQTLGEENGLELVSSHEMPANNKMLFFKKVADGR